MYPALLLTHPEVAKSIVEYRYRTMPGARANAKRLGYQGLFYPWNSASNGDLATECHSVDPPHCITQIHLQGDIALAVWQYYLATGDTAWLRGHGWPMLSGIAQFWASRVTANADGSYSITNVAGPDEYSNGVNDGVYTNAVAATALRAATRAAAVLGRRRRRPGPRSPTTADALRPDPAGLPAVRRLRRLADQAGRHRAADLPGGVADDQPGRGEHAGLLRQRTDPDGPAMTDSVHAIDAAAIGQPGCATHTYLMRSIVPFVRDPFAQFAEARGSKPGAQDPLAGSPAFNFLTGEGGFLQVFTNGLTGLRWRSDRVHLDPMLPPQLGGGVTLRGLHWQGRTFDIAVGPTQTTLTQTAGQPFTVESPQGTQTSSTGASVRVPTRRPDLAPTDDAARCKPAQASTEEPGMYAEAAVDGSAATIWAPDPAQHDGQPDRRPRRGHHGHAASPHSGPRCSRPARRSWSRSTARPGPRPRPPAPTATSPAGQRQVRPRRVHPRPHRRTHRPPRAGGDPRLTRADLRHSSGCTRPALVATVYGPVGWKTSSRKSASSTRDTRGHRSDISSCTASPVCG